MPSIYQFHFLHVQKNNFSKLDDLEIIRNDTNKSYSVVCICPNISEPKPSTPAPPPPSCPPGYVGEPPECKCYEDNTAYFGNNVQVGSDNHQASRAACQRSCAQHPTCQYWTWGKGTPTGPCYLKTARDNVTPGLDSYVSGSKHCTLPEAKGNYKSWKCFAVGSLLPGQCMTVRPPHDCMISSNSNI